MLVDLDHPESPVIILVEDRLDRRGFAGAGIAVEQHVVGGASFHEGFGILDQLFLLNLIAHQIVQHHVGRGGDRNQKLRVVLLDTERLVEAELSDAVGPVEVGDDPVHLLPVMCALDGKAQRLDLVADALVVNPLRLADGMVVLNDREAADAQLLFDDRKIVVKELAEDLQIVFGELIDRPVVRADLLRNQREGRLRHRQQKRQIVMPEVPVKTIGRRHVQKPVDLIENFPDQLLILIGSFIEAVADVREPEQNAVLRNFPVNDQFRCQTVHVV